LCADRLPIARQRESAEDLILENIGHYKRDVGIALMRLSRATFVYDAAWIAHMYDCMWTECGEESAKPSSLKSILIKTSKIAGLVVGIRNNEEDDEKRTRIAREYCSMLCGMLDGRTFVKTHNGYIGLGPAICRPGDQIFSILGGNVPYVLRPTRRQNEYQIFGAAYVHGVMDGELWKTSSDEQTLESRNGDFTFQDVILL
jgi:hypothetical protein